MAEGMNWSEILKDRFPTYKIEEDTFIECLDIASSMEVYIEKIYEAVKDDQNVHPNLIAMYHEASVGGNKDVVKRIRNRISNIRRNCK